MNKRASGWSRNNWSANRKHSVEYSRHLCDITRSTTLTGKTRPRTFSDSEATRSILIPRCTYNGQYDDFRKRNLTMGRQESVKNLPFQGSVLNTNKEFHGIGGKNEVKDTNSNSDSLAAVPHQVNGEVSPMYHSMYCGMDEDDDRSACDSVLSFACSGFTNVDVEKQRQLGDDELISKTAKFDAIETWLQHLPKPVLRTKFGKTPNSKN